MLQQRAVMAPDFPLSMDLTQDAEDR